MNTSDKIRRGRVVSPHFQSMMKCLYHEFKVGRKFSQNILNQVFTGKGLLHGSWSPLSHHSHWVTQEWMVPRYPTGHPGPIFHWHRLHARNWGCWSLPWAHLDLQGNLCKSVSQATKASSDCCSHVILWWSFYSKAKLACYSRYLLTSYFCIPVPYDEKDIFFLVLVPGGPPGLK